MTIPDKRNMSGKQNDNLLFHGMKGDGKNWELLPDMSGPQYFTMKIRSFHVNKLKKIT